DLAVWSPSPLVREKVIEPKARDGWGKSHIRIWAPSPTRGEGKGGASTAPPRRSSSRDELVPAGDHVAVFVHHRIPAGDVAHALEEGAAVANGAGLFHHHAIGRE